MFLQKEDEVYEKFGITRGGEPELSSEKRTAQYTELRDLLDSFRTAHRSYDETIEINLTHNMSLQDIFDSWYDLSKKKKRKTKTKSKIDNGGIFFRELDSGSEGPNENYKGNCNTHFSVNSVEILQCSYSFCYVLQNSISRVERDLLRCKKPFEYVENKTKRE